MLQPKDKVDYPMYFYEHQLGKALILDENTNNTIKYIKKIIGWTMIVEKQLIKLNLGSKKEPKDVLINSILPNIFQAQIKKVLMEYKDVFAWSYNELKGIQIEVCKHKIELMVNVQKNTK
jgi:hypothetical protein